MIRLSLGANTVALTLAEKSTITDPTYLFEFINNQTQVKYYCIAADSSVYKERYNLFTITVQNTAPSPLLGQIKVPLGDEYNYNIYEQVSTTNLNPAGLTVVESGYMTFDKSLTTRREYDGTTTRRAYEA